MWYREKKQTEPEAQTYVCRSTLPHCGGLDRDRVRAEGALAKEPVERLLRCREAPKPLAEARLVVGLAAPVARALGDGAVEVVAVADGALDGVLLRVGRRRLLR